MMGTGANNIKRNSLGIKEKVAFIFSQQEVRDQSLLMVGGGAEDIKGGSPIIFLPRWGGQIKNQTARGGAMKNNQLKLTSILFRNK